MRSWSTANVISFVMLAGGLIVSARSSKSTLPVAASITMAPLKAVASLVVRIGGFLAVAAKSTGLIPKRHAIQQRREKIIRAKKAIFLRGASRNMRGRGIPEYFTPRRVFFECTE